MNEEMIQEWMQNPVTLNYIKGVKEGIEFYKAGVSATDMSFTERDIARKVGVIQGLEALLTYDPEADSE